MKKSFPNSLEGFLQDADKNNTVLVTDFDGTIYRGFFPFLCRGIANADLGIILCLLHITSLPTFLHLVWALVKLALREVRLYQQYRTGEICLTSVDRMLIEYFTVHILRKCEKSKILAASRILSHFCYRYVWISFGLLRDSVTSAIISKSFVFVLESIRGKYKKQVGADIQCYGVNMLPGLSWQIDTEHSILSKKDKSDCLTNFLHAHRTFKKALVIGDTEDDRALKDGAVSVLGKRNVFFISVNAKDTIIRKASDLDCPSWKDLYSLLRGWRNKLRG